MKPVVFDSSRLGFVYTLSSPDSEQVRYVGQTVEPETRFYTHLLMAKKQRTHKDRWLHSLALQDKKPVFEVVWLGSTDKMDKKEDELIALFKSFGANLTNATLGGKGSRGRICTPEMKARQSAIQKGRERGWKYSAETIEKIRLNSTGKKLSESARAKISAARTGQPSHWSTNEMPEQFKQAIADRGRSRSKKIIAIKDGVETIYYSQIEAQRATGCGRKEMRMVANGIYKQSKGYQFNHA